MPIFCRLLAELALGSWVCGNCEDHIFVFHQLFGPVNQRQNWKGWERSGDLGDSRLSVDLRDDQVIDNQAETCLIITINDTYTCDLPLIVTTRDTSKKPA